MKLMTRIAFAALLTTGFSLSAQAADVQAAPAPAQDPIVQHLKLSNWKIMFNRFRSKTLKMAP